MSASPATSQRHTPASMLQALFAYANGAAVRTVPGGFWVVEGTTASLAAAASEDIDIERANENGLQRRFRLLSVAVETKGRDCKVTILHRVIVGSTPAERSIDDLDGSELTDFVKTFDPNDIHAHNAVLRITHDAGTAATYDYCIVGQDLQTMGERGVTEA